MATSISSTDVAANVINTTEEHGVMENVVTVCNSQSVSDAKVDTPDVDGSIEKAEAGEAIIQTEEKAGDDTERPLSSDNLMENTAPDSPVPSPMPDWARVEPIKSVVLSTLDITRQDEIKRTIRVDNVSSRVAPDDLLKFFRMCGPINFVRLAGDPKEGTRCVFVEFTNQDACNAAVTLNNISLKGKPVRIDGNWWFNAGHSLAKQAEKEQRGINEAMKRLREVEARLSKQFQLTKGVDCEEGSKQEDGSTRTSSERGERDREERRSRSSRRRSSSRSPRRYRSRSPSRTRAHSPYYRRRSYRSRSSSRSPSSHRHSYHSDRREHSRSRR